MDASTLKKQASPDCRSGRQSTTPTPDRFVIGAFAGSRLVGMAGFSRYDRAKARHRGQISQVYVDPESHGRSVARR